MLKGTAGLTLTAYCGPDRILCRQTDQHTDRLVFYREPTPEAAGEDERGAHAPAHLPAHTSIHFLARNHAQTTPTQRSPSSAPTPATCA